MKKMPILLTLALAVPAPAFASGAAPTLPLTKVIGGQPATPVIDGHRVYLAAGRTVATWDYSDRTRPERIAVSDVPTTGEIVEIARVDGYLYAGWTHANEASGVAVYSLADPDRPVLVNEVEDYATGIRILRSVAVANGHLYLFDAEAGVFQSDLQDPVAPAFQFVFRTPTRYGQVTGHGQYLYARAETLGGNAALVVFDVSDPANPVPVGGSAPMFSTQLFAIDAAPPWVAGFGDQLTLLDASDPANVLLTGAIETPPASRGVLLQDRAWSFGFDGIDVWNVQDPEQPAFASHVPIDLLGAEAVAKLDGDVLVATRTDRLALLDASNPATPALASAARLPGGALAKDIGIVGEHAILLQDAYGIAIADARTLEPLAQFEPDLPAQLNMRSFEAFAIEGNLVYLAAWAYGLLIVDVSDPLAPVEVGRYPFEFASEVAVNGGFAYVARSTNGGEMRVIDVSDPAQPLLRGVLAGINEPRRLQAHGATVYMADALLGGIRIIDVADPDMPVQVGLYDVDCEWLGNTAHDVVLDPAGETAYVACPNGMHVVDIRNPTQPARLGWYVREPDFLSARPRVDVLGDRGWYADGSGVHEIDLTDPASPAGLSVTPLTYTAPARLRATADGRLFAFAGASGVHVFSSGGADPEDLIFADGFEGEPVEPVVIGFDDVTEGFKGSTWNHAGLTIHDVNGIGGVFPNGDTFTAADVGDQVIVEDATFFYDDFPQFGSAPNALTFGTAYVPGPNLSLGAFVKARINLDAPASSASMDIAYFENGPWIGIVFHLEAWNGGTLVASDSLEITGEDPEGRDRIALATLAVSGAGFDSLRLYATYGDAFSAPRLFVDDLTIVPAVP